MSCVLLLRNEAVSSRNKEAQTLLQGRDREAMLAAVQLALLLIHQHTKGAAED